MQADLRPVRHYLFRSATGLTVDISSRLGEDSARIAAMQHFWGPPCQRVCGGRYSGTGLSLIAQDGEPRPAVEA